MIIFILLAIFFGSVAGLGLILYKKMPALADLPDDAPLEILSDFLPKVKKGLSRLPGRQKINYELYLQRVLSKTRVLMLKTENKTSQWLEKLRQKSNNKKNNHQAEKYWDELKKIKDDQ